MWITGKALDSLDKLPLTREITNVKALTRMICNVLVGKSFDAKRCNKGFAYHIFELRQFVATTIGVDIWPRPFLLLTSYFSRSSVGD